MWRDPLEELIEDLERVAPDPQPASAGLIPIEQLQQDMDIILYGGDEEILTAKMDNPVQVLERECSDRMLTICGESTRYRIVREVAISEVPPAP